MSKIEACSISSLSHRVSQCLIDSDTRVRGRPDTFLPFVKYWGSRVVDAFFFRVSERLPTALVHTSLSHVNMMV